MFKSGLKWMFLIIGTMIGAGYASGRELWEFFGVESSFAIFIFTILFSFSCYTIMNISFEMKTTDYTPVLEKVLGKRLTKIYDSMIILYLYSVTVIMLAGGGATLEVIQISYWSGVIIIASLVVVLFLWDTTGITSMNSIIIPILIICLVGILVYYNMGSKFNFEFDVTKQRNWPSAFTFTALNILPLFAVIAGIGNRIKQKGEVWIASIGSGVILGIISFLYNESLIKVSSDLLLYEIPLFAIMKNYPTYTVMIMSILLWFAIYTTATAGVFGLTTRFKKYVHTKVWVIALVLVASMIPLTTIGFSTLVAILYPLYGVLNLYILAALLLYPILKNLEAE